MARVSTPPPPEAEHPERPAPEPPAAEPRSPEPGRPARAGVEDPVVRRRLGLFATLLVACFATSWLSLPWSLATIVFAGWALVVGIMTLRRVRRTKERGLVLPLLIVGVFSALMLVLSTSAMVLVWPVQQAWQECRAGAVTVEAREQCDRQQRID